MSETASNEPAPIEEGEVQPQQQQEDDGTGTKPPP